MCIYFNAILSEIVTWTTRWNSAAAVVFEDCESPSERIMAGSSRLGTTAVVSLLCVLLVVSPMGTVVTTAQPSPHSPQFEDETSPSKLFDEQTSSVTEFQLTENSPSTDTDTGSDTNQQEITRSNADGVYQTGRVTEAPEQFRAGESVNVTIQVTVNAPEASGNIVYGAIGSGNGTLYGVTRMSSFGSGTVTVTGSIPDTATGEVYWTWVPAISDSQARERAIKSLRIKDSEGNGRVAYSLGEVQDTETIYESEFDYNDSPLEQGWRNIQNGQQATVESSTLSSSLPGPQSVVLSREFDEAPGAFRFEITATQDTRFFGLRIKLHEDRPQDSNSDGKVDNSNLTIDMEQERGLLGRETPDSGVVIVESTTSNNNNT